jgi:hypothetical protein
VLLCTFPSACSRGYVASSGRMDFKVLDISSVSWPYGRNWRESGPRVVLASFGDGSQSGQFEKPVRQSIRQLLWGAALLYRMDHPSARRQVTKLARRLRRSFHAALQPGSRAHVSPRLNCRRRLVRVASGGSALAQRVLQYAENPGSPPGQFTWRRGCSGRLRSAHQHHTLTALYPSPRQGGCGDDNMQCFSEKSQRGSLWVP